MKRVLVVLGVLILAAVLVFTSCLPTAVSEPGPSEKECFCEKIEIKVVDFEVLNEARDLIQENSVFQEIVDDPEILLNGALESYFAFLSIGPGDIPQWARDIVAEEITEAKAKNRNVNFACLNEVHERMAQDPNYENLLKEPSQKKDLIEAAITGLLDALKDPFSSYVSPEAWASGSAESTVGRYRGLGITLRTNNKGEIVIDSVKEGSPAQKAGLQTGDVILEVNDKVVDCTILQFTLKLKSLKDPDLKIKIRREVPADGKIVEEEIIVNVTMEIIKIKSVSSYPVVGLPEGRGDSSEGYPYGETPFLDRNGKPVENILYIKIKEFSVQAAEDLGTILASLDMTRFSGVIVDLRGNPGGRVDAVAICVGYFLEEGFILFGEGPKYNSKVYLKDGSLCFQNGNSEPQVYDQRTYIPQDIPIAIITGKGQEGEADNSYSGAEVFAAALRDNGRAVIVSREERTGGKGSVNQHFPLRNGEYGGLYIAIGMWRTPNGEIIECQDLDNDGYYEVGGLKPDILVKWTEEDHTKNLQDVDYDLTLWSAIDYIRSK